MQLGRTEKPAQFQTEAPLMEVGPGFGSVVDKIGNTVLDIRTPLGWFIGFGLGSIFLMMYLISIGYLFARGVGIWGVNIPVGWGFAIISFVWWIGIGHAGTLISAILFLLRQEWRTSINRFAEAMTLFAVACAGIYPILHLGRPWLFYWIIPYPNTFGLWPQFRSPLSWDVFAITAYGTTSALFWFVGLIPDLAAMRDKASRPWLRYFYGILALGWRGSAHHWHRYESVYLLLAAIATPLVVSVHTVVSFDFATSLIPGWHTTIFPPYFVAGAIFSGFAMVISLLIPLRKIYKLEGLITPRHFDVMSRVMLTTGLIVAYGYVMEIFSAWYSGSQVEIFMVQNRTTGPYAPIFWALIFCNILVTQLLWFKQIRRNLWVLFVVSLLINTGMWLERFVIVVTSLHRDYLPSSWGFYSPTVWDWGLYLGSLGFFLVMLFIFVRTLPLISIFEVSEFLARKKHAHPKAETGVS
ncbi:MAG: NrfD/PsrC family molybdoenzyme membrane anchor subunit [Chloroflexota bacterium]